MKRILVGGGARSGKSAFALRRARELGPRRAFVATAEAGDAEMAARIARHVQERGPAWRTIECPLELEAAFAGLKDVDVVLLDCLTFWISNLLCGGLSEEEALARVRRWEERVREAPYHLVVVTNEVGLGLVPETPLGRAFRDVAGRAHQLLAPRANEVYFGMMGQILRLKPEPVEVV
ncbi:MAG TPA: bifunctional adenosylcobinamide kinase/adenosylcobinamide-phosphate guanylyltransferase [Planctomycetota bacterium]